MHGSGKDLSGAPRIKLRWVGKKGEPIETDGIVGETILEAAHRHEIELEGAWGSLLGWVVGSAMPYPSHMIVSIDFDNNQNQRVNASPQARARASAPAPRAT